MTLDTKLGRCLCKAVRFRVIGAVRNLCYCHCESCRRAVGATPVAWGTVDRTNFEITQGELSVVNSSKDIERGFCSNCGTTLTYRNMLRGDEIDFTLASLEDPAALQPQAHLWVQDKLPWVKINDGLPQYKTVSRE